MSLYHFFIHFHKINQIVLTNCAYQLCKTLVRLNIWKKMTDGVFNLTMQTHSTGNKHSEYINPQNTCYKAR